MKQRFVVCILVLVLCSAGLVLNADPLVDCKNKKWINDETPTPSDKTNKRNPGEKIKWKFNAKGGTIIKFEMKSFNGGPPQSPLENTGFKFSKKARFLSNSLEKKIKQDAAHGQYVYEVTCVYEEGPPVVIDPIIEIPRSQLEEEQKAN